MVYITLLAPLMELRLTLMATEVLCRVGLIVLGVLLVMLECSPQVVPVSTEVPLAVAPWVLHGSVLMMLGVIGLLSSSFPSRVPLASGGALELKRCQRHWRLTQGLAGGAFWGSR